MSQIIRLVCEDCGANIELVSGQRLMTFCPYCGRQNLIIESDEVKIAQINANASIDIEKEKTKRELADNERLRRNDSFSNVLRVIKILLWACFGAAVLMIILLIIMELSGG